MKKALNSFAKFLLIFAIFFGLQGRVIVRFASSIHNSAEIENTNKKDLHKTSIRTAIKHCKLQCYTQHFRVLNVTAIFFLLAILLVLSVPVRTFIRFQEEADFAEHVRLLPLRAPPVRLIF